MPQDAVNEFAPGTAPPIDLTEHIERLDKAGLLIRVDRPINKDTELQPLVRWQFVGGIPEDQRRAFLFTHVVDSKGHRYDMPVAVGALASSPRANWVTKNAAITDRTSRMELSEA